MTYKNSIRIWIIYYDTKKRYSVIIYLKSIFFPAVAKCRFRMSVIRNTLFTIKCGKHIFVLFYDFIPVHIIYRFCVKHQIGSLIMIFR